MPSRKVFGATRFNAPGSFAGLDFSLDGRSLVALVPGDGRTKLHRFRVEDGQLVDERTISGHWSKIAILPDGGCLLWSRGSVARIDAGDAVMWKVDEPATTSFFFVSASSDGSLVAIHGSDSAAHVLDGRNGKRLQTVREPKGEIFAVAFAPDGTSFATGGEKGIVRLFDRKTKKERAQRKSTKVLALAFSPDGDLLAGGHGNGAVLLWQVPSLKPVSSFRGAAHRFFADYGQGEQDMGPAGCRWVSFAPDGKSLLSAGNDYTLRMWDLDGSMQRRVQIPRRHPQGATMALARDGRWIAAGSTVGALSVWNASGEPVTGERSLSSPHAIALTSDRVVVASAFALSSWRREDGRASERAMHCFPSAVLAAPEGKLLVLDTQTVYVVDDVEERGDEAFSLDGSSPPGSMALSSDGTIVAIPVYADLEWWDWKRGVRLASVSHESNVKACAFGPGDEWIVSVADAVRVWRVDDPASPLMTVQLDGDSLEICGGVAVSPRGWIAVSMDRDISNHQSNSALVFIDPRSRAVVATLDHPEMRLGQVAFLDETRAVVVDSSGRLLMADAEKGCWLDLPADPDDVDRPGLEILPLAVSADGTEVAHIDAWQNVTVRKIGRRRASRGKPFVLEGAARAVEKPGNARAARASAMFEERLAGTTFLFAGRFQSSGHGVRTTPEFREETVRELGGTVARKPKGITHFVAARQPYAEPVPSAAERAVDELIARGEKIVKLSEKEMIDLLFPTFDEARAMLRGEIEGGVDRWNRWRSRYAREEFVRLAGIDLSGADLRKANLMVIHFEEACLAGARLAGVDLFDCVFRGADLRGADLDGAKCYRTNFVKADLREARLTADLTSAVFDGADLRGADLRGAKLEYASLKGAKLDGAKLPGSVSPATPRTSRKR